MISVVNSTSDVADPCAVPWTLGNPRRPLLVSGRPEAGRGAVPVLARAGFAWRWPSRGWVGC